MKGGNIMKKQMILATIAVVAGFLFMSGQTIAGPANNLNWGYQLNASETACPSGDKVLNVVRKVINSLDSGTGANDNGFVWWAYIDYVQQIQVIETEPGVFCATVKSQGSFESVGGDGPGCVENSNCGTPEGRLESGVVGTFQGGMTLSFEGTFNPGSMRTRGSIGTLDHNCDASTAQGCDGPGFSAWLDEYFTGVSNKSYDWWGWVYHAGNNGSWVNKTDGNEGNITGD
jgi:hypothetical protein